VRYGHVLEYDEAADSAAASEMHAFLRAVFSR
jgi:hypothetical protein